MSKRTLVLSLFAVGLLAITAFTTTVSAKPGDGPAGSDHPAAAGNRTAAQDRQEDRKQMQSDRQQLRDDRKDKMEDAKDAWKAHCVAADNETLNSTVAARCMMVKEYFQNATKAKREAHALMGAIAAMERRIGRLEVREHMIQHEIDSGNLTANQTAAAEKRIEKINAEQDRMVEKLMHLRERLAALHEKWQAVREDVAARRHAGEDPLADDESESSSSSSSSAAAA